MRHRFITFLTDFGLQDDFVGACHGVVLTIAPEARIIDITHGISPGSVLQGALVLENTVPFMPVGVHLAVVDPGVGGSRRPLALRDADGRVFVGPDNGLLIRAAERDAPIAAAHAALGVDLAELGPPLDPEALVRLDVPQPEFGASRIRATVLYVDRFGNVQLNLTREHLDQVGVVPGTKIELELGTERYYATAARTFGDARSGDIVLYEDAYRNVSIAINRGSAAEMFGVRPGNQLRIHVDTP